MTSAVRFRNPSSLGSSRGLLAWLSVAVVLVNVIGGTLLAITERADEPWLAATALQELGTSFCHSSGSPGDKQGDHGKPVCPMCFPLGNACSGAVLPVAAAAPTIAMAVERVSPPTDHIGYGPSVPLRKEARAPPSA